MGVDEIYLGKKQKFITVVSNLGNVEPVWFGRERKKETLDEFFQKVLSASQRMRITAACVDMWEPYRQSVEQWRRTAALSMTSSTSCSTPTRPSMRFGGRSLSRRGKHLRELVNGKRWLRAEPSGESLGMQAGRS